MKNPDYGKTSSTRYDIQDHVVEIRQTETGEQLFIDGVRRKILVSDDGYNLYGDAYAPPQPSLIEAVKAYFAKSRGDEET